jgi:hypothetical protein
MTPEKNCPFFEFRGLNITLNVPAIAFQPKYTWLGSVSRLPLFIPFWSKLGRKRVTGWKYNIHVSLCPNYAVWKWMLKIKRSRVPPGRVQTNKQQQTFLVIQNNRNEHL